MGTAQLARSLGPAVVFAIATALVPLGLLGSRLIFAHLFVVALITWWVRRGLAESDIWVEQRKVRDDAAARGEVVAHRGLKELLSRRQNVTALLFLIGVLFWMNVRLALLISLAIVPIMTVMTLWFRHASERTYGNVRDRIADLLADLQENLSGIRIITAYNRQRFNLVKHRNIIGEHYDANVDSNSVSRSLR